MRTQALQNAGQPGPQLRDIHVPPPPSWWPPAPGWWLLVGLCLLLLAAAAWFWLRRRRRVRRWHAARRELAVIRERYVADGDGATLAAGISQLLRRAARVHDRTAAVDGGERWHRLLRTVAPDRACADTLLELQTRMYRPHADIDGDGALQAAGRWLRRALMRRPRRV